MRHHFQMFNLVEMGNLIINKKSHVPIYFQLEEAIKEQIEKGILKPGDLLPSEREYAEEIGVSRMTVRQAITKLVHDGFLYRIQGKGTYVAEGKIEQPLARITSFTEDMIRRGLKPGSQLLSFETITASPSIAKQLEINEHSPVYEIRRIRLADGVPIALETTYIDANLCRGLDEDIITNQSLYEFIEGHLQLKIANATQSIESSIADIDEVQYLDINKGAPVLLIEQRTFLENSVPVEIVKSVYRADRYKFKVQLKR